MKRATKCYPDFDLHRLDFNPRPREEGDSLGVCLVHARLYFNPRPREEGDATPDANTIRGIDFNPRPREEGDKRGFYFFT